MKEPGMLTIGEVASRLRVSTDTVRYYEKEGLVKPKARTDAGYRLYTEDTVRRLRFIKQAQQCGFSLSEVRELLELQTKDEACCDDVRHRAITKKLQLEQKIRVMQAMSQALSELIAICKDEGKPLDDCPIVAALETGLATPEPIEERK
jgi:MerR family Zn(II)-responsive transcriptional regulator of zntA